VARRLVDPDDVAALQMAAEHLASAAQEERWSDVYTFASQIARMIESPQRTPGSSRPR
jgi:hypothetical protein